MDFVNTIDDYLIPISSIEIIGPPIKKDGEQEYCRRITTNGDRTYWVSAYELDDVRQRSCPCIPNHNLNLTSIIFTADDEGVYIEERPIIGWKRYEDHSAAPVLTEVFYPGLDSRLVIHDAVTDQCWIPDDRMWPTRAECLKDVLSILSKSTKKRAAGDAA